MTIRNQAEQTARAIVEALQSRPNAEQSDEAVKIIEQALVDAYKNAAAQCKKVADTHDTVTTSDKSLVEDIRVLIANLSSMR